MSEPTPRQLWVLIAWIECGSSICAGERLGMTAIRVRQVLADLHSIFGVTTSAQAFAVAVRDGLIDPSTLKLPEAA